MDRNVVAISTALGNGGISIVRMSGKSVVNIADKVFSCKGLLPSHFEPRKLYLGLFECGDIKDKCMCVYFKGPNSYTGEDLIEFHCHGGMKLTNMVVECLVSLGCEPAGKGEFSKLAFLNGKISLDEAEGIIDMINAESESELKAGYSLMKGNLHKVVTSMQDNLTELLAKLEVTLDYPEEDLEEETRADILVNLTNVKGILENLLSTTKMGRCIKDGLRILIYGKTNAGKSSLLNALLGYDRAIVTDIQGTTRDTLEEGYEYKGYKFILIDSAGIRESSDVVESIGIDKAKKELDSANVVLYMVDGTSQLDNEDENIINSLNGKNVILVVNKVDIGNIIDISKLSFERSVNVSAVTGEGIDTLKEMLYSEVVSSGVGDGVVLTNLRHVEALTRALEALEKSIESVEDECVSLDLVSIDIKSVWLALGEITGNGDNEKIIDDIFSKFCVGK